MTEFFATEEGFSLGIPSGYIAESQAAGLGSTEALNAFRDAGGAIRTQTWYRAWGQVSAGYADRVTLQGAPMEYLPDPGSITTWSTRTQSGYLYHFNLATQDAETGAYGTTLASLRTDELLTPDAALGQVIDLYADNAEIYGEQILGGVMLNIFQMDPVGR